MFSQEENRIIDRPAIESNEVIELNQLNDLIKNFEEVVDGKDVSRNLKEDFINKVLGMVERTLECDSQTMPDTLTSEISEENCLAKRIFSL